MNQPRARGLLDRTAAAEYLSISISTLRKLVDQRDVPTVRVLSATRYAVQDLDAYIERLRRAGG